MLFWRWMAVVFAISAAFPFVSASYFISGRWNVSAIDFIGFYGQPLVLMLAAIFCALMDRREKGEGRAKSWRRSGGENKNE